MATETVSEAEKMRRVPGVYFATEPSGRCAKVAGTGIGVWEIIDGARTITEPGLSLAERVALGYDWLTPAQRQAALDYYAAFPDEIDAHLARQDAITPEWVRAHFPRLPGQPRPPRT
ncbi:MAG TPA: hypothetical protein VKV26_17855 [Dehalococcoidia bacterium]|nr:hypothetical protein [Dehalococcoidia bacterium]